MTVSERHGVRAVSAITALGSVREYPHKNIKQLI